MAPRDQVCKVLALWRALRCCCKVGRNRHIEWVGGGDYLGRLE